ncbi:MAG: hypothetical protein OK455_08210 [Thaumarchaeota archaeon]|nr:hypothetical protein [Nitrososphaerota archaeon]
MKGQTEGNAFEEPYKFKATLKVGFPSPPEKPADLPREGQEIIQKYLEMVNSERQEEMVPPLIRKR